MAKTKVRIDFDSRKAASDLLERFEKVRKNRQMNNEIGNVLVDRIKLEARRTQPLNNRRSFPGLKDSTIDRRRSLGEINRTHPVFSPARSNLSFSGQLIDAIRHKFDGKKLVIFVDDNTREPYILRRGGLSDIPTNAEVYKDLVSRGFVLFTKKGVENHAPLMKRVNNIVKRTLRRALRVK